MNRDCVLWVNMPHQLGITLFVLVAVTIGMSTQAGAIFQKDINNLCQQMTHGYKYPGAMFKGDQLSERCKYEESCPYYCHCQRLKDGEYIDVIQGASNKPLFIKVDGETLYDWDFKQWATRDPDATM